MFNAGFRTALVCMEGHVVCSALELAREPLAPTCAKCGAQTISACEFCYAAIRGVPEDAGPDLPYRVPSYCHRCGHPYLWSEARLQAGHELIGTLSELGEDQKKALIRCFDSLLAPETPRTQAAAVRFVELASLITSQKTKYAISTLVSDVASDTAKKVIGSM